MTSPCVLFKCMDIFFYLFISRTRASFDSGTQRQTNGRKFVSMLKSTTFITVLRQPSAEHPEKNTSISIRPIPTIRFRKIAYKLKPKNSGQRSVRFDMYGRSEHSVFMFFTSHEIAFRKTTVMGHRFLTFNSTVTASVLQATRPECLIIFYYCLISNKLI